MLIILSPAKTMREIEEHGLQDTTLPQHLEKTRLLDEELKFFDEDGYYYNESLSKGGEIVFTR